MGCHLHLDLLRSASELSWCWWLCRLDANASGETQDALEVASSAIVDPVGSSQFRHVHRAVKASMMAQLVKNPPAVQETLVPSLGWEDPLEEDMATHSSILAWRIPWTEEPGGLQSRGSQRGGCN